MKQVIQSYKNGKVELIETPAPLCSAGRVLVKNAASLISVGTEKSMLELGRKNIVGKALARPDLVARFREKAKTEGFVKTIKEAWGRLDTPTPLGYSSAGIVVEVGSGVQEFSPGDRVACMGAGFASHAEYISVPQNLCVKIPEGVSYEEAAFGTLGAIALHGVRMMKARGGEQVAVIGLGLIGLLAVQVLKAYGFQVFGFDVDESKVKLAKKLGCDYASSDSEQFKNAVKRTTKSSGADAVIIACSTKSDEPVHTAVEVSRYGGRVVVIGVVDIHPERHAVWEKEVEILVSKAGGPGIFDPLYENRGVDYPLPYVRWTEGRNLEEFLRLLAAKKVSVEPLISHRFQIEEAERAYKNIIDGKNGPYVGVVLEYPKEEGVSMPRVRSLKGVPANLQGGEKVSVGVIGAGVFGKALLIPALQKIKGVRLHTLASASGATAYHIGSKYGFGNIATDYMEVLKNKEIEAVLILAPHRLHAQMTLESLKAGKHVFVEKPLCVNEEELKEISGFYDSLSRSGRAPVLMVGYNRRFSSHTALIKEFLKERQDPLIVHYRANVGFVPKEHWVHAEEEGGGRIVGEVCHFVDLMQFWVGKNPVRVYAERISGNDKTVLASDNTAIVLKFEDGSIGNIVYTASGSRAFSREEVELFCEGKTAVLTDFKKTVLYDGQKKKEKSGFNQELGHKEELEHFIACVKGGEPVLTPDEIFTGTRAVFKIVEALETGKPQIV